MRNTLLLILVLFELSTCKSQFVCGDTLLDYRDGNIYQTVLIGSQCWMAENLKIGNMLNSTSSWDAQTDNGVIEKYCYNNLLSNCETYGGLYQWDEMMSYSETDTSLVGDTQGICPEGWHIPTHHEWTTLERQICSSDCTEVFPYDTTTTGLLGTDEGGKLKHPGTTFWIAPNEGATNSSGFTALPTGTRISYDGSFAGFGDGTSYWSSTEIYGTFGWYRVLSTNNSQINRWNSTKDYGRTIRCLCDPETLSASPNCSSDITIEVYPNPAEEFVNIKIGDNDEIKNIAILSINGQTIYCNDSRLQLIRIDIGDFPKGIYLIRVTNNYSSYTGKLIIK